MLDLEKHRLCLYETIKEFATEKNLSLSGLSLKSGLDATFLNPSNTVRKAKRFIAFNNLIKIIYKGLEIDLQKFTEKYLENLQKDIDSGN